MFGSSARAEVLRTAIFYTPLFLLTVAAALLMLVGVWDGGPVLFVIDLLLAFLFGFQSVQSLRDLRSELRKTRGPISRIWSKMDLIVTRSYYIRVGSSIFRIPFQDYYDLREEAKQLKATGLEDEYRIEVEVTHYPHTGAVEKVERLGQIRIDEGPVSEPQKP
jgi:hypothetical protein